jgi:hypothetical protein
MSIKKLSPKGAVNEAIQRKILRAKQTLCRTLSRVGEECVNYARIHGGYMDQTGNLRSSIGYIVLDEGRIFKQGDFTQVKDGSNGIKEGKEFLNELISKHSIGIVLIVVAGMNYAAYVEARYYDVISGSELQAEVLVPSILKQLGFNLKAA